MRTKLARIAPLVLAAVAVATLIAPALTGRASVDGRRGTKGPSGIRPAGEDATFTPVFKAPLGLEGLTGDHDGNLYSAARGGDPCPVWRVRAAGGDPVVVGNIAAPCSPSGIAFDHDGDLFIADGDRILTLTPSSEDPPTAEIFATDVPGANGIAFDQRGRLWVSDGTTGQGRVWRVGANGVAKEMFRVQPMANEVNVVDGVGGVGRDVRSLPPGTVTITPTSRQAANLLGSQPLVANGLAFTEDGSLLIADTARGAIWKVELNKRGQVSSPVGCDTTFAANTLCLDNVMVAHPYLEGVDGIALDRAGNVWAAANERNAIVVVTRSKKVIEFFRNPPDQATQLRNQGPMEFPTSPFLVRRRLCITHSDGNRRDNVPNSGGEVGPAGPELAKISCLDQPLEVPGLRLPVD